MWTSRKGFVCQLAWIEQRQVRIHQICQSGISSGVSESVPTIPDECYNIGKSQHRPIVLNRFISQNPDNPAIAVCIYLVPHFEHNWNTTSTLASGQSIWTLQNQVLVVPCWTLTAATMHQRPPSTRCCSRVVVSTSTTSFTSIIPHTISTVVKTLLTPILTITT